MVDLDVGAEAFLLPDERSLPEERVERRRDIAEQLRQLPEEALTRIQYFQPQVGCFNRCAFCSQHAGTDVWQFSRTGLRDLFAALGAVTAERGSGLGGGREHKPRVLFPYLDNDIGSYLHLDEYVALARDVLGCTVRMTTVGFSEHNEDLVRVHRRVAEQLHDGIAGLRLSITPFTAGWTEAAQRRGETSRAQFVADLATTLRTYRVLLERRGLNRESLSAEFRFRPLAVRAEVEESEVDGRHVLRVGPHLLVSSERSGPPETAEVTALSVNLLGRRDITASPEPVFSRDGSPYLLLTDARSTGRPAQELIAQSATAARRVLVWRLENADGAYYAVDPLFADDGSVHTLNIYPATDRRKSGYQDSTRFLLNALLEHKRRLGRGRREELPDATPRDVAGVLGILRARGKALAETDPTAAEHIRHEVLPLVADYARALLGAGLPASLFFSRQFTLDTGPAINQGRALVLFKGLSTTEDTPISPWQERGDLISASKGHVWRLAPAPFALGANPRPGSAQRGGKNTTATAPSLIVQEVDPRHLRPVDQDTGRALREYRIDGVEVEHVRLDQARTGHLYPGLLKLTPVTGEAPC
ncbi:hypothetical protein [Actinosynnema pretiosum]|uniref:hypothetical protein n=1 Tax=Actinosynnema pretiosum TaxID=42197 RepID=UPI0015A4EF07|nr:hypothetical protein [Actinosynnema pretiosum]